MSKTRVRTNILKKLESSIIQYFCKVMPEWMTSDMLTGIGLGGSILIGVGLYLANSEPIWLALCVAGFAIQWFGDSLDGRLAYYRNIPRKWYGWALDISVDWISIGLIGGGFYYYFDQYKFVSFLFVFAYGWSMINSLLKYRITDRYSIDTFLMGPTEVRILICIFLVLEYLFPGTLL
ncbi:MAG: hypothetical protein WBO36_15025, partial [Saprospiraceae bacterium]